MKMRYLSIYLDILFISFLNVVYFSEYKFACLLLNLLLSILFLEFYCEWNCFLNFVFSLLITTIYKHNWFLLLKMCSATLLNSFISSNNFCGFLRIIHIQDYVICEYNFISPFPNMLFILFSCLIILTGTSKTMLNKGREKWHPCLIPDFREEVFSLSSLKIMLAIGFLIDFLY